MALSSSAAVAIISVLAVVLVAFVVSTAVLGARQRFRSVVYNAYFTMTLTGFKDVSRVKHTRSGIPKIIWTFWDSDDLPMIVAICIQSWMRYHSDYTVVVVTKKTLPRYLPGFSPGSLPWNDSTTREADIIRINLLAHYGGMWSDASILLFGPFPGVAEMERYPVVLYFIESFTTNPEYKVVENWWFATVPRGRFITEWRDAFMMYDFDGMVPQRLRYYLDEQHVDPQKISGLEYLFMHVAAQYVLQKRLTPEERAELGFMKAEDGPFRYLVEHKWDPRLAVDSLCFSPTTYAINKIRGCERSQFSQKHLKALLDKLTALP